MSTAEAVCGEDTGNSSHLVPSFIPGHLQSKEHTGTSDDRSRACRSSEFMVTKETCHPHVPLRPSPWLRACSLSATATFSVLASSPQRSLLRGVPGEAESDRETFCPEVHQEVTGLPGQQPRERDCCVEKVSSHQGRQRGREGRCSYGILTALPSGLPHLWASCLLNRRQVRQAAGPEELFAQQIDWWAHLLIRVGQRVSSSESRQPV